MFFRIISWTKVFSIVAIAALLWTGDTNAMKWEDCVLEQKSLTVHTLPKDPKEREDVIKSIFTQNKVSLFDLSKSDIEDKDIPHIAFGIAFRNGEVGIKLLDISSEGISKNGIESLLKYFQNGVSINEEKRYPDVREMIMKVSAKVDLTDELLNNWYSLAPSTFAGGLTSVE